MVAVAVVVPVAGTEKAAEVRVGSGVVVGVGNYQEIPFVAVTNQHPLLDNQSAGAAEKVDAGQDSP